MCVGKKSLSLSLPRALCRSLDRSLQTAPPPPGALHRGSLACAASARRAPEPAPTSQKSDLRKTSRLNVLQAGRRDRSGERRRGQRSHRPTVAPPRLTASTEPAMVWLARRSATCVMSDHLQK